MVDGMGSAWVSPKRKSPSGDVGLIKYFTDLLAKNIEPWRVAEFNDGPYYDALDDLRALVNLPPVDR